MSLSNAPASRPRLERRGASGGFTLIEALVAIVILALSLSALLSAHNTGLRGAATFDDHLRARLLAQSLLAEWSRHRAPHAPARGQNGRFTWTVSVSPFQGAVAPRGDDAQPWMLHELTVTVEWPHRRQIRLNTLRLLRVR